MMRPDIAILIFRILFFGIIALGVLNRLFSSSSRQRSGGQVGSARSSPQSVSQSRMPSSSSVPRPNSSSSEIHMNAVSAVIFLVFAGAAALTFMAQMPIGIPILLALIGVFLGYSVKMAQQWER